LSVLLSLLGPALGTGSPDCGGILTPSGLSYRKSGPHLGDFGGLPTVRAARDLTPVCTGPRHLHFCSSRNQINSVKVTELSLALIPDAGLRLSIDVDLSVVPAPSTTKVTRLSILADFHLEMNPEGNLELVPSSCRPTVEETQSSEQQDRSTPRLSSLWGPGNGGNGGRSISGQESDICLEVSKLLLFPNEQLMSLTAPFPITPSCQLQYQPLAAPVFSEQGITVSLQTTFQVAGTAVPLPVSPVPFSMPEPASSRSSHLTLAFSEHFYTSLFFALEAAGAFNVTVPVRASCRAQNHPPLPRQMGSLFQEDRPVLLQAVFRSSPRVLLEEGKAALQLFLTVHVGAGSPAFQSFLSVNVDMSAGLLLSVADTRMLISAAAIEDIELSLAASDVGPVPADLLQELFLPAIHEEVPAQMNAVLREGVFLPHISSVTYTDANVAIHKGYALVTCNLQLQARTG
ncbi:TENP protein, partial [Lophotis ruficrista]|nr:TENP protein [Lophotis ruficrista]